MDMLDELDDDDREGPTTLPRACLLKALKDVSHLAESCQSAPVYESESGITSHRNRPDETLIEFVNVVSIRASEICTAQAKKTMTKGHVMESLEVLNLSMFKDEQICELQERHLEAHKKRRQSSKLENLGIPEEELLRKQEELFRSAREQAERLEREEFAALQAQLAAEEQRSTAAACSSTRADAPYAARAASASQLDDENYDE